MSDDLVKRLRMVTGFIRFETGDSACLSEEAADRIEELEAQNELLQQMIASLPPPHPDNTLRNRLVQRRATIAELKGEDRG